MQINSIYIDGVKANGKQDLSARDDWQVDYRFYSPAHRQTALSMAAVSEDKIPSELRMMFEAGVLKASLTDRPLSQLKRDQEKDAFTPTCAMKKLMGEAAGSKDFEQAPFLQRDATAHRWKNSAALL